MPVFIGGKRVMDKPRLIDADKVLDWASEMKFEGRIIDYWGFSHEIRIGTFDPDPIPIPTIKPGDKVRHKDKKMQHLGIGIVKEIAASGERALVIWPNYDKKKVMWAPIPAYYRLDKLEVVE